jgi:hypothetical protein
MTQERDIELGHLQPSSTVARSPNLQSRTSGIDLHLQLPAAPRGLLGTRDYNDDGTLAFSGLWDVEEGLKVMAKAIQNSQRFRYPTQLTSLLIISHDILQLIQV